MVDKAFIYAYATGNPSWPGLAYVDPAGFKLTEIPLSLPPKCWNSKHKSRMTPSSRTTMTALVHVLPALSFGKVLSFCLISALQCYKVTWLA